MRETNDLRRCVARILKDLSRAFTLADLHAAVTRRPIRATRYADFRRIRFRIVVTPMDREQGRPCIERDAPLRQTVPGPPPRVGIGCIRCAAAGPRHRFCRCSRVAAVLSADVLVGRHRLSTSQLRKGRIPLPPQACGIESPEFFVQHQTVLADTLHIAYRLDAARIAVFQLGVVVLVGQQRQNLVEVAP